MATFILLADQRQDIRDSLRLVISRQPGMEVVAEAENEQAVFDHVRDFNPDVVLIDIKISDLKGSNVIRQLVCSAPEVKIVVLSNYTDWQFIEESFKAGASGYLLKDRAFEELARAIETVTSKQTYLSPGIEQKATA